VDSKEVAFVTAGRKAFLDALGNASPVLLEPIVDLQVTAPQSSLGDITRELSAKRGRINGTEALGGGMAIVNGQAPLAELGSFHSELKSATGGAGSYTLSFSHYEPVPPGVQQELAAAFSPTPDDD
jgi:elongation factor G